MLHLIRNAQVIDGTGAPRIKRDVLIKNNVIAEIGKFPTQKADRVTDATGFVLTPGFIDINTDSDHYLSLFKDPYQENFVTQGVTTIIGGHSGSSLAPLIRGDLRSIRKWANINEINVDWNTVQEFFETLSRLRVGVNFGTLVGHTTIRRGLIGEENRHLTKKELTAFKDLLRQSLKEGAFGFSTGLRYNHAKHAPYEELTELIDIVAKEKGLYATHLRNEHEDITDSVDEIIGFARETGARTLITHFRAMKGFEAQFHDAFEHITNAANEIDIQFDGYPFDYSIIPIYTMLPKEFRHGNFESMCEVLEDESLMNDIHDTMPRIKNNELIIAQAQGFDFLVGKSLNEFAKSHELTLKKALLYLMKVTKLRAVLFRKNINHEDTLDALFSEHGFIASNSPSQVGQRSTMTNERAAHTFRRFLQIAKDREKPLEWAVQKITQKPAALLNLKSRGVIKEGRSADLVLLKNEEAQHVFVNGTQVVKDGVLTKQGLPGEVLRKK